MYRYLIQTFSTLSYIIIYLLIIPILLKYFNFSYISVNIFQIDDCIQSCALTNNMLPMVRRYRPVRKIYSAYQNLRKLKGPKHWYASSNYFSNQASFNFRSNSNRRFKVSFLLKYFWVDLGFGMVLDRSQFLMYMVMVHVI